MDFNEIKDLIENDRHRKHFVGAISTYKDLRDDTEYIIEIFKRLVKEFTVNMHKSQYFALYFINRRPKILKYSEKNHIKVNKLLSSRKLKALALFFSDHEFGSAPITRTDASFQVLICEKQLFEQDSKIKNSKNEFSFSAAVDCYGEKLDFLINLLKELFVNIEGINGYMDCLNAVHICGCSFPTAHENLSCMYYNIFGDYINKLRGYFWITILTNIHIENLGGKKYTEENIPNFKIEKVLMHNGTETYFCMLTDNIFEFNKARYLELKKFLQPLLYEEDMRNEIIYSRERENLDTRRLVFSKKQCAELDEFAKRNKKELENEYYADLSKNAKELAESLSIDNQKNNEV